MLRGTGVDYWSHVLKEGHHPFNGNDDDADYDDADGDDDEALLDGDKRKTNYKLQSKL